MRRAFKGALLSSVILATAGLTTAAHAGAIIDNGVVQLGVRDFGDLNEPGGTSSPDSRTGVVGLRQVSNDVDSTSPGCTCEGWGIAIRSTGEFGNANSDVGGVQNMSLVNFTSTASTATSTVEVLGTTGSPILRVTHDYNPAANTDYLYQVDITVENLTGSTITAGDLVYRRVMDWDIPVPGREYVSIQGVPAALGIANGVNIARTDNNGFNSGNPLSFSSFGLQDQNFVDENADHGALFDFEFGDLTTDGLLEFTTYYGVAPSKAEADLARSMVDGDPTDVEIGLYSYGVCGGTTIGGINCDIALGEPATFIFGFGVAGGVFIPDPEGPGDPPPPPPPPTGVPAPASLASLAIGLAGLGLLRRRRRN